MKLNKFFFGVLILMIAFSFAACGGNDDNVQTFLIGPELRECTGVAPMMCMMVKKESDEDFLFFYDKIEGFEYEEGFDYELLVRTEEIENPPMDASSLKYILVELVNKTPAK